MMSTKRRRLYIEAKKPQPGDWVELGYDDGLAAMVTLRPTSNGSSRAKRWCSRGDEALLLGLNRHLDYVFVMLVNGGTLGWVKTEGIRHVRFSS